MCPESPTGEISLNVAGGPLAGVYEYKWSDNSSDNALWEVVPGIYSVVVTDANSCSVTANTKVLADNDFCLIIHDAFSPNGDQKNDVWNIQNIDLYPQAEVSVYNRWGQLVWRSDKGYHVPWNGRDLHGNDLQLDSYHYAIDLHNGTEVIVGTITIVR
jgi:gliding motility-associated-like protein